MISLPKLPESWDELTPEQMVYTNKCRYEHGTSEENYLLHMFMYFTHTAIVKGEILNDEKEKDKYKYLFQQVDEKGTPCSPKFPMEQWQIHYFITEYLQWLLKPCTRLNDLFPVIQLEGKEFGSPGYAMANMTYQQQKTAQQYHAAYCQISNTLFSQLQKIKEENISVVPNEIKELLSQRQEYKCKFLATVYSPEAMITQKQIDGETIQYTTPEKKYIYNPAQSENNWKLFRTWDEYKGDAVIQLFNGVMIHYKKIFPLLFTETPDNGPTDYIEVEQSTINALQSELQFSNYQTIYDSNAPFIFGKLNDLILSAKKLKEQELRSRAHKRLK